MAWPLIKDASGESRKAAAAALRQETGGHTLEDAFIALTGHSIREAEAAPVDRMRMMRQVWRGRR